MHSYPEATLTINLNAIAENYKTLCAKAKNADVAAVVKANAYGLGVKEISARLYKEGCREFFVAHLEEALQLRPHLKNDAAIFIFHGVQNKEQASAVAAQENLIPVLNAPYQLKIWSDLAAEKNKKLPAILHVDTGITRLGFDVEDALTLAREPTRLEKIELRYVMSHLACAENPEHRINALQLERMQQVHHAFPNMRVSFANSFGIFSNEKFHFHMVRPGMALYGLNPTPNEKNPMRSVVNLTSKILQRRLIDTTTPVGYGATAYLPAGSIIAVVPVGYADGYLRSSSNVGMMAIEGICVPIVGRVSMDMMLIDITQLPEKFTHPGHAVELLGSTITADQLANWAGTIGYEILTNLGNRFAREYVG